MRKVLYFWFNDDYLILKMQDLMKKNKKGRVNCAVERKVATQIIASEPKLVSLLEYSKERAYALVILHYV